MEHVRNKLTVFTKPWQQLSLEDLGDICLTAEYSNPDGGGDLSGMDVVPLLEYDIKYVKKCFSET